ncbi:MAG: ABC transporter ATP-binding protein [Clostridia bacterium]|nr:ABC transporter ATP-binding protein [Clostridia bacterium]
MKKTTPLKWIVAKSKGQRANMVALIFSNTFFSFLTVAFAFAVKTVIDGAVEKNVNVMINGAIFIGAIILLQFLFRVIINGLAERVRARLEIAYKTHLFSQILKKKYHKITEFHSGELLNRLTSDVKVISDGVTDILPQVVGSVTRLVCAIVALIIIDWIFAIAFVIAGVAVFVVMGLLRGKLKFLHKKAQETDGKTRAFMQESIENMLVVKVSNANEQISEKANSLQEENFKIKMKRKNYSVLGVSTYNFIFSAGYVFALIFGGVKIFNGVLGYGDLSAILQLVNSVQVPFASLSNVAPRYFSMLASAERLMEIDQVEEDEALVCKNPLELYDKMKGIVAKDVCFSYGDVCVLKNASFTLNKGQSVAVVGRSGAGKSTLIKILLGIYDFEGEVYLDAGEEKIPLGVNTRSLFTFVPQGNMLFSGSLRENLIFMNEKATDEQIERALKIACADEFVSQLPEGLNTILGEGGSGLSEGQIQRLAIARAVLSNAPIMLLDEATSALDRATEHAVIENLLAIENRTVIMISHRKEADSLCERTLAVSSKTVTDKKV